MEKLSAVWQWTKEKWNEFNDWLAGKLPGWKTQTVAGLYALANVIDLLAAKLEGMDWSTLFSTRSAAVAGLGVAVLIIWARSLGKRDV